jgi:hypothetical protein
MGIDDREDKLARFCLVTGTFTIEHYCKRRLLKKKIFEQIDYTGDLLLPLREYPVISVNSEQVTVNSGKVLDPKFYRVVPDLDSDLDSDLDIPFSIELSPVLRRLRGLKFISVVYTAGYVTREQRTEPPHIVPL